ncbi:hypothetical protein D3C81_1992810 [compost metagenome]
MKKTALATLAFMMTLSTLHAGKVDYRTIKEQNIATERGLAATIRDIKSPQKSLASKPIKEISLTAKSEHRRIQALQQRDRRLSYYAAF